MNCPILPVKDLTAAHPIATAWRPLFTKVVDRFVMGDFELLASIPGVKVATEEAIHNRDYIAKYGESLVCLGEEVWQTSCAQWDGTSWDVIIDLCTQREGVSDMVLTGKITLINEKPEFTVGLIYVP